MTRGAFITVRYWCPNLFNDEDLGDQWQKPEDLVRYLAEEEGVLGIEESNEVTDIRIV